MPKARGTEGGQSRGSVELQLVSAFPPRVSPEGAPSPRAAFVAFGRTLEETPLSIAPAQ